MPDFENQAQFSSPVGSRAGRIYWNARLCGLIAVTVPLVFAFLGAGLSIAFETGTVLLGLLGGARVGRLICLVIDRKVAAAAEQSEIAGRREFAAMREAEAQKAIAEMKANRSATLRNN